MRTFDAVVLTGGSSRRLNGAAKVELLVGSRRLIDVAVAAVEAAETVVIVGPRTVLATGRPVQWTREDPTGGGPVAALCAALALVSQEIVIVLAGDLPFVTPTAVTQLVSAAPAVAIDSEGRDQPLLAAYSASSLRAAMPAVPHGARLRDVLSALAGVSRVGLDGAPPPWWDCDTPAELEQAREWHDAG